MKSEIIHGKQFLEQGIVFLIFAALGGTLGALSGSGSSIRTHCEIAVGYAMTGDLPVIVDIKRSEPAAVDNLDRFLRRDGSVTLNPVGLKFVKYEDAEVIGKTYTLPMAGLWLQFLIGAIWRCFGFNWNVVAICIGSLFVGISGVFSVAILRKFVPPVIAILISVFACISPVVIESLPHFRDFSKLPFFIFSGWLALRCCTLNFTEKRELVLIFAGGLVLGFGLGFRTDILLTVLVVAACITFGRSPEKPFLSSRGLRVAVTALFLSGVAFPEMIRNALVVDTGEDAFMHWILLGQSNQMTRESGSINGDVRLPLKYLDLNVAALANDYSLRKTGEQVDYLKEEYGDAVKGVAMEHFYHTPYDQLIRLVAVIKTGLSGVSVRYYRGWWLKHSRSQLLGKYVVSGTRYWVKKVGEILFYCVCVPFMVFVILNHGQIGVWLCSLLMFWLCPGILQFDGRHLFHVEFLRVWILGVSFYAIFSLANSGRIQFLPKFFLLNGTQLRWLGILFFIGTGAFVISYIWQVTKLDVAVGIVKNAGGKAVEVEPAVSKNGFVFYPFSRERIFKKNEVCNYLRLNLRGLKSEGKIWILYERISPFMGDLSLPVSVCPDGEMKEIYLPIFDGVLGEGHKYVELKRRKENPTRFRGLLMSGSVSDSLVKVEVVDRVGHEFPPYLFLLDQKAGVYDLSPLKFIFGRGRKARADFDNGYYPNWFTGVEVN